MSIWPGSCWFALHQRRFSADGAPLSGFGKARARRFQAVDAADSPISEWGRTFSLSWRQKCTVQKAAEREDEIASLHFNFKLQSTSSNKQATNASIDHTSVRSQKQSSLQSRKQYKDFAIASFELVNYPRVVETWK